ncbi:MAG: hypothetical protein COA84_02905 [Robiginitomaculum sp.]|nr:MAG: hypothetical protein COA84_02905 [Robiginitomaculum sp.]
MIGAFSNGALETVKDGGLLHVDAIIVSRALCGFQRISLPNGSRNAIKAALLQAERDAPSEASLSQLTQDPQNKKMAGLWTWPATQSADGKNASTPIRSFPETLARQPMSSGRRLVQCLDGVEGQVWDQGGLIASRWWPDAPEQGQWLAFLRSARLKTDEIDLAPPPVTEVPWRTDLPVFQGALDLAQSLVTPLRLVVVSGTVLGAVLIYSGAQYLHYSQTLKSLQTQIAARKELVSDVLADRNQAMQNLQTINTMIQMGGSTALLEALAGMLGKLQGKDLEILRVSLTDGQVFVRVKGKPDVNGAALVKLLESDKAIEQVSVNFKRNDVIDVNALLAGYNSQ